MIDFSNDFVFATERFTVTVTMMPLATLRRLLFVILATACALPAAIADIVEPIRCGAESAYDSIYRRRVDNSAERMAYLLGYRESILDHILPGTVRRPSDKMLAMESVFGNRARYALQNANSNTMEIWRTYWRDQRREPGEDELILLADLVDFYQAMDKLSEEEQIKRTGDRRYYSYPEPKVLRRYIADSDFVREYASSLRGQSKAERAARLRVGTAIHLGVQREYGDFIAEIRARKPMTDQRLRELVDRLPPVFIELQRYAPSTERTAAWAYYFDGDEFNDFKSAMEALPKALQRSTLPGPEVTILQSRVEGYQRDLDRISVDVKQASAYFAASAARRVKGTMDEGRLRSLLTELRKLIAKGDVTDLTNQRFFDTEGRKQSFAASSSSLRKDFIKGVSDPKGSGRAMLLATLDTALAVPTNWYACDDNLVRVWGYDKDRKKFHCLTFRDINTDAWMFSFQYNATEDRNLYTGYASPTEPGVRPPARPDVMPPMSTTGSTSVPVISSNTVSATTSTTIDHVKRTRTVTTTTTYPDGRTTVSTTVMPLDNVTNSSSSSSPSSPAPPVGN